jgi:hypothetical protein
LGLLPFDLSGDPVDDEAVFKSEFPRALVRAPEVRGEVERAGTSAPVEHEGETSGFGAECGAGPPSPPQTCRMLGISSGQLYTWRKQFRRGELTGFVRVAVMSDQPQLSASDAVAGAFDRRMRPRFCARTNRASE